MTEKELLQKLYVDENKSLTELAELFKTTRTTVTSRLRKYGIPIKPRGGKAVEFKIEDE